MNVLSNPFATRFTGPGSIDWIGPPNLNDVLSKLARHNFRGAVVGSHGAGKSTLLEHLAPQIGSVIFRRDAEGNQIERTRERASGQRSIVWLQLRKSQPNTMRIPWSMLVANDILILDGYEQLSRVKRAWVIFRTRVRKVGLLVTSHRASLLPTLFQLHITTELARKIVEQLVVEPSPFDVEFRNSIRHEIGHQLQFNGGNMRELLMSLYDRFEQCRSDRKW